MDGRRNDFVRMIAAVIAVCAGVMFHGVAAQQDEAEHESLRQLRAVYETAMRDSRPETLAPFLHDDFHGVMVTGRIVRNVGELTKFWSDIKALIGDGGNYSTTLEPERSVIIGDVALARGTSQDVVVTRGGQEFRFTTIWTAVLQKADGQWKVRQMQGTIDPVDNVFIREFTRRALLVTGAVSAVVGGLLTWGLIVLIGRRRARRSAG